jgi:protein-tyrosine phosphatase
MKETRILFICLGNICRSPAAHGIMEGFVKRAGLSETIHIDSAGIGSWHIGKLPDSRMRAHAADRGYDLLHKARLFNPHTDFDNFDLILVMDEENYTNIIHQAHNAQERQKVRYLAEYLCHHPQYRIIPDPYYGGADHFELVLDLIEDACHGLLDTLVSAQ